MMGNPIRILHPSILNLRGNFILMLSSQMLNPRSGNMVCSPPNVQKVCVELEIQSFTNNQVLSPTISEFFDDLINNILRFCSHVCQLRIAKSWQLSTLCTNYTISQFTFVELPTIECFAYLKLHPTATVLNKIQHMFSESCKFYGMSIELHILP